jgi:acyl transferase domain-containing protein
LSKAVADGDHIYALIRSTGINHGGKTNGYTVPSPLAQGEVIRAALDKVGIDARTVTYIEAHGTGTELGDPIEIAGLTHAFCKDTEDTQYCAIGSVKSNIGHLEAAAGIAGIAKIILQMKHQKLVPSLHSKELNPNIDFDRTPFVVQQELADWKRPVIERDGNKVEYPRIAGISSFGAGGANAHVIIEEYVNPSYEQPQITVSVNNPAIIILSAKNEERLKEQVQRLLNALDSNNIKETELADIAYTLQVGREAMEERMAVIVSSMNELREKLKALLENRTDIQNLYRGQVKRNREALSVFTTDDDMKKQLKFGLKKGNMPSLQKHGSKV